MWTYDADQKRMMDRNGLPDHYDRCHRVLDQRLPCPEIRVVCERAEHGRRRVDPAGNKTPYRCRGSSESCCSNRTRVFSSPATCTPARTNRCPAEPSGRLGGRYPPPGPLAGPPRECPGAARAGRVRVRLRCAHQPKNRLPQGWPSAATTPIDIDRSRSRSSWRAQFSMYNAPPSTTPPTMVVSKALPSQLAVDSSRYSFASGARCSRRFSRHPMRPQPSGPGQRSSKGLSLLR
jgi:hypothetical protein